MPNWCNNTLKIIGEEEELKKFSKKIKKKTFLSSFIPLPKELENTKSPTIKKDLNLIYKYKYDNWYDWKITNWGTKWDFEINSIDDGIEEERTILFDSAWNPPIEGIKKISKLYPNLIFFIDYDEPGNRFRGLAKIHKGKSDDKCFQY